MASCRVALVLPDFSGRFQGTALGLAYLGGALLEHGHAVTIFDFRNCGVSREDQADAISSYQPDIVGFSSTSPSLAEAIKLAYASRVEMPDTKFIKGGPHESSHRWLETLDCAGPKGRPLFDVAVTTRWGEATMVALADQYASDGDFLPTDVPGVSWSDVTSHVLESETPVTPCAPAHPPARHLLPAATQDLNTDIFGGASTTQMMVTRGCRYSCTFCAIDGQEARPPLDTVKADIARIRSSGFSAVFLDDASFTADWPFARQVGTLLHDADLPFAIQTRSDLLTPDRIRELARRGCRYLYIGIESGSLRIQRLLRKRQDEHHLRELIETCRRQGVQVAASMIFGIPMGEGTTDGPGEWRASTDLIRRIRPNLVVPALFAYYPGSPAWRTLPRKRKNEREYVRGTNHDPRWNWFDDGKGAIHAVDLDHAMEIRHFLQREIGAFLGDRA